MDSPRSLSCIRCGMGTGPEDSVPIVVFVPTRQLPFPTDLRMCVNCGSNGRNVIGLEEYEAIPKVAAKRNLS